MEYGLTIDTFQYDDGTFGWLLFDTTRPHPIFPNRALCVDTSEAGSKTRSGALASARRYANKYGRQGRPD